MMKAGSRITAWVRRGVAQRRRFFAAVATVWLTALAVGVALAVVVASEPMGWPFALAGGAVLAGGAGVLLWLRLGKPLLARTRPRRLLGEAENRTPALRRRLSAAYDLAPGVPAATSAELARAFVADVEERLEPAPPRPGRELWPAAAAAVAGATAWAACFLFAPTFLAERWAALAEAAAAPGRLIAAVEPGDARVGVNRDLVIRARLREDYAGPVTVVWARGGAAGRVPMRARTPRTFEAVVNAGPEDFRYYVAAADEKTRRYAVTVVPPPLLGRVAVTVYPPAYAGLPPTVLPAGDGDCTALAGSRVAVRVGVEGADDVAVETPGGGRVALTGARGEYEGAFTVTAAGSWRINAASVWGSVRSPAYAISLLPDGAPEVAILAPARDWVLADRRAAPPLRFRCADDYGLGAIRVVYVNEVTGEQLVGALGRGDGRRELEGECALVPDALGTFPGDTVAYYVEAWDNDTVNGPKVGRSATYRFRFPTSAELFAQVDEEMGDLAADARDLRDEVRDFQQDLARITPAGENGTVDRAELRELASRQERLRQELADAAAALSATLDRADALQLSPTLAAKLVQVNRLLEAVLNEQQKETIRKLNEALRTADPARVQELMKQLRLDQAEMERRLDAIARMLEEARREELLNDLASRAEELAACQDDVGNRLAAGEDRERLAQDQGDLAREVPALGETAADAARDFEAVDAKLADELREAARELRAGDAARATEEAAAAISGEAKRAPAAVARASAALNEAAAELRALADRYRENKRGALLAALDAQTERVLAASHATESLAGDLRGGASAEGCGVRAKGVAAAAAAAAEATEAAAAESALVPAAAAKALAAAAAELEGAARSCELGDRAAAAAADDRALAALNLGAAALLEARANVAAAGSPTGLAEMLERMKALAEGQRGLNQEGQALFSLAPGMTPGAVEQALAELAAEQALLRQALEKLAGAAAARGDTPAENGALGGMADEMEEIENDLRAGRLDERVLEKQEKLLDRMLTATRSLRVEGRTSRRRAEPAKAYAPAAVAPLPARLTTPRRESPPGQSPPRGGYIPAEMRALVEDYYRRLAEGE
jgi:hypothetical protein